jgi:hypothetical protein
VAWFGAPSRSLITIESPNTPYRYTPYARHEPQYAVTRTPTTPKPINSSFSAEHQALLELFILRL